MDKIVQSLYEDTLSAFFKILWDIAINSWWHKNIDGLSLGNNVKLRIDIFSKTLKWC